MEKGVAAFGPEKKLHFMVDLRYPAVKFFRKVL